MSGATLQGARGSLPSNRPSQNACLSCRNVKMKCKVEPPSIICGRCIRKSLSCVFEKHRRGRKRGTRVKKAPAQANRHVHDSQPPCDAPFPGPEQIGVSAPSVTTSHQSVGPNGESPEITGLSAVAPANQVTSARWEMPGGLQPAELLSSEARSGNFSLQNILSIPEITTAVATNKSGIQSELDGDIYGSDDPISAGILTYPVAVGLFDNFMRYFNPFTSHFDSKLHSFDYVRRKSSFLLSVLFTATAKAFHPALYSQLRAHRDALLGLSFARGDKSVEVVQAILITTYWKEPDESRTWLLIGYAIRMCLELGWHELKANKQTDDENQDELAMREARNIERTWLILFVYDRSLSSQMGKPWMIDQNDLIQKTDEWHNSPISSSGVDILLSAFVRLRIIHCEMMQLVSPASGRSTEVAVKLLNMDLAKWEIDWVSLLQPNDDNHCQRFLLKFYGLHLRLLLNSFFLQTSLSDSKNGLPISKVALWTCFSSAVGMLEQISQEIGPLKLLYFAQDSVHVMTAYAAIFLIKLLFSLPMPLRSELEGHAISAIRNAGNTFKDQCITPQTGCALQARFLGNVVEKYEGMRAKFLPPMAPQPNNLLPPENMDMPETGIHTNVTTGLHTLYPSPGRQQHIRSDPFGQVAQPQDGYFAGASQVNGYDTTATSYSFTDNDMWELMFADAGFRINEGVFMNDNAVMNQ